MRNFGVRRSQSAALLSLLLLLHGFSAKADQVPASLLGAWQLQGGDEVLVLGPDQWVSWRDGQLRVLSLLKFEAGLVTLRRSGLIEQWGVALKDGRLVLKQAGKEREFQHLPTVPESVQLAPLPLASRPSLSPEKIAGVQADLAERLRRDQEAVKSKTLKPEEVKTIIDGNSRHLRALVQEIGWIDAERFGSKTSYAAVILAKHGGDLRLLLAALPLIEKDFRAAGDDAQAFAIVFDSVQLDLGRKQRFGTQIRGVGEGKPFVLPLEDPQRVDELRKEIGLPPLAEYLSDAGKVLQMEISMPPKEDVGAPPH